MTDQRFIYGSPHDLDQMLTKMSAGGWCVVAGTMIAYEDRSYGARIGCIVERQKPIELSAKLVQDNGELVDVAAVKAADAAAVEKIKEIAFSESGPNHTN